MRNLRKNYLKGSLLEDNLPDNPYSLFKLWFARVFESSKVTEANAMVLSTVNKGAVDSRVVLLKDLRDDKFVFYTNYKSHKGQQLLENPNCTILFPWVEHQQQIIVRGTAKKVSEEESTAYFLSRPESSQIGAWVSEQSKEIDHRDSLDKKLDELTEYYKENELTKPPHWGGFEIEPYEIEFWQGRENRLHDRILFELKDGKWETRRLQP